MFLYCLVKSAQHTSYVSKLIIKPLEFITKKAKSHLKVIIKIHYKSIRDKHFINCIADYTSIIGYNNS